MLQTVSRLLPELPLILMTAVATHLVMSFAQTLMHYKLGHRPMGGKFFRNLCVPKIRFCNIGDEGRRGQAVM